MSIQIGSIWKCLNCGTSFIITASLWEASKSNLDTYLDNLQLNLTYGSQPRGDLLGPETKIHVREHDQPALRLLPCPTCCELSTQKAYSESIRLRLPQTPGEARDMAVNSKANELLLACELLLVPCKPVIFEKGGLTCLYQSEFQGIMSTETEKWTILKGHGPRELQLDNLADCGFKLSTKWILRELRDRHETETASIFAFANWNKSKWEIDGDDPIENNELMENVRSFIMRLGEYYASCNDMMPTFAEHKHREPKEALSPAGEVLFRRMRVEEDKVRELEPFLGTYDHKEPRSSVWKNIESHINMVFREIISS